MKRGAMEAGLVEQQAARGSPQREECEMMRVAREFVSHLGIHPCYFDPRHNKCYCPCCFDAVGVGGCPERERPNGCCGIGLKIPARAEALDVFAEDEWRTVFHGTSPDKVASVMNEGGLLKPGDCTIYGRELRAEHTSGGPARHKIYTTPSPTYASHKYYTGKPWLFRGFQCIVMFQCRQTGGQTGGETVGWKGQISPYCPNDKIENFTDARGSIIIYRLLVKLVPEAEPIPAEVEPIPAEVEPISAGAEPIPAEAEPIPAAACVPVQFRPGDAVKALTDLPDGVRAGTQGRVAGLPGDGRVPVSWVGSKSTSDVSLAYVASCHPMEAFRHGEIVLAACEIGPVSARTQGSLIVDTTGSTLRWMVQWERERHPVEVLWHQLKKKPVEIRVRDPSQVTGYTGYKIHHTTPMRKIKRAHCQRRGFDEAQVHLRTEGGPIIHDLTCNLVELGMSESTVLEIVSREE
jgi:hypothetical protein